MLDRAALTLLIFHSNNYNCKQKEVQSNQPRNDFQNRCVNRAINLITHHKS